MRAQETSASSRAELTVKSQELDDLRAEVRALRAEEQRAAMLADELRSTKAELESLSASHRAELIEREADLEQKVRSAVRSSRKSSPTWKLDMRKRWPRRSSRWRSRSPAPKTRCSSGSTRWNGSSPNEPAGSAAPRTRSRWHRPRHPGSPELTSPVPSSRRPSLQLSSESAALHEATTRLDEAERRAQEAVARSDRLDLRPRGGVAGQRGPEPSPAGDRGPSPARARRHRGPSRDRRDPPGHAGTARGTDREADRCGRTRALVGAGGGSHRVAVGRGRSRGAATADGAGHAADPRGRATPLRARSTTTPTTRSAARASRSKTAVPALPS